MSRGRHRFPLVAGTAALVAVVGLALGAEPAGAHPLGNFTTNTYAGLEVESDRVLVDYVVDLAEIPTLRLAQQLDGGDDGDLGPAGADWAADECRQRAGALRLTVGGRLVGLGVEDVHLEQPAGQAGLRTTRVECGLASAAARVEGPTAITFEDPTAGDRTGWREITAVGTGADLLASDVPRDSSSGRLRAYPDDRLSSPLDQRAAVLTAAPGPGTPAAAERHRDRVDSPGPSDVGFTEKLNRRFTSLIADRNLPVPFVVFAPVAVLAAVLLGAGHALLPGHGKTVVAAYLVGQGGSRRLAILLGLTVASTHTFAVLVLGALFSTSEALAPQDVYRTLGLASGLLFAALGVALFRRALRTRRGQAAVPVPAAVGAGHGHLDHHHGEHHDHGHHDHHHDHDDGHDHDHDHDHDHGHGHVFPEAGEIGWKSVFMPGLAGGLVPSPSAVLVYVSGSSTGRPWFGTALIVAFGLGIAGALVGAGFLLARARTRLTTSHRSAVLARGERLAAALPLVTSALVVAGGLWLAYRAR